MTRDERILLRELAELVTNHLDGTEGLRGRPVRWEAVARLKRLLSKVPRLTATVPHTEERW